MSRKSNRSMVRHGTAKLSWVPVVSQTVTCRMKNVAAKNSTLPEGVQICSAKENIEESTDLCVESQEHAQLAGEQFVHGLGKVLSLWVRESVAVDEPATIGRFHSSQLPSISIHDYIKRLRKLFLCSEECFVIALVYIDKICKNNASVTVSDVTVHRLLVIAVVIAAKFHDDHFYSNKYYGKAGGLTTREINMLEALMLKGLNWRLLVTAQEYNLYHDLVCKAV